ncbi:hypothetical protein LTR37_009926 [Vermiconidia calcicola]|uniref:Uncharacterized protein n=1 Tax=Vermiconidia calcicola TaxID=1690605 RepID=A0ACC3N620_9PEZI|nr:hypothetical protein LTR37_009926 [Vermiconidia calcicola]
MSQEFAAVVAAAIDGRTHNVFHRQTQLQSLHETLRNETSAIRSAILSDTDATSVEAAIELYTTIKSVADAFYSLQPLESLEEEYLIAKGKNAVSHREPLGIVYIEPTQHTGFYSCISTISSAIAAGNCIVILLERNLRETNAVLRRVLTSALEPDSFVIADEPGASKLPLDQSISVLQNGDEQLPRSNQLVSSSSSSSKVVAFVDRTADLRLAARELVAARFSFGGRSPYAPDLVLVNEFAREEFLGAVVQECVRYGRTELSKANGQLRHEKKSTASGIETSVNELRMLDAGLKIIAQEARYAVVELASRQDLLGNRLRSPVLAIYPIRSLDDGLAIVDHNTSSPCTAAYHFGTPETGKYLCQFVPAAASFVNHVPRQLLLGPAAPLNQPINLDVRYPYTMFTHPRPQYAVPNNESIRLEKALYSADSTCAEILARDAFKPLSVTKRHNGKGVGFFELGFLINASMILAGTVFGTVTGAYLFYSRSRRG